VALDVPPHGDVLHPRLFLVDDGESGIADDDVRVERDQVEMPLSQLTPEHGGRPPLRAEQVLLDRQHVGDVPPAEPLQARHCSTGLRADDSTASGRRR
jgi:hypothetical protein